MFEIWNGNWDEIGYRGLEVFIRDKRRVWFVGFRGDPWEGSVVDSGPLDCEQWDLIGRKEGMRIELPRCYWEFICTSLCFSNIINRPNKNIKDYFILR